MRTTGKLLSASQDFTKDVCVIAFETPLNTCTEALKLNGKGIDH